MKNVLISYKANNYASRCVLAGIQKFVERTGDWITRVVSFPEVLTADMVRRAPSEGFDGILLPDVRQADVARAVVESPLPVSLNSLRYKDISSRRNAIAVVDICDDEVGRTGARHFRGLGKFRSYAFAPFPGAPDWSENRRKGFVSELALHGIRTKVLKGGGTADEIAALEKPAAIMAAYDYKAIEIMGRAQNAGFAIPSEIAVIGVDADPIVCGFTNPPLTSVEPGFERFGYAAAAALDAMMRGRKLKGVNKVRCPPKGVVERASTLFLPTGQALVDRARTIIASEAAKGLSAKSLAVRLHVSPQYLSLRFRQFERTSPRELIIQTRLDKVKAMLRTSKAKPDAIAAQCGFSSANRLAHLFKARFGCTMGEYRHRDAFILKLSPEAARGE